MQGLDYPGWNHYQPNNSEANSRFYSLMDLLNNNPGLDFDGEFQKLVDDLNTIYNK